MKFSILGIGTALPDHQMSQSDAAVMSADLMCRDDRQRRLLTTVMRRSRVSNRHTCIPHQTAYDWVDQGAMPGASMGPTTQERMALYAQHAGPLSLSAARNALQRCGVAADQITHLVTVSCTGFASPGFDVQLIEDLHLSRSVQRTHVGYMGCHGAINGLRVAGAIGLSDPKARVLMCATELCSLHYRMCWDEDRMLGNVLFADGAAAFVGTASLGNASDSNATSGNAASSGALYRLRATGSFLTPDSAEMMSWRIGDHGFEMSLSGEVPDAIRRSVRPWLTQWLASNELSIDAIGSWAIHPGGPRILAAVEETLGLPPDALEISRGVLNDHGNMSSPTLLFILDRMARRSTPKPCVAMAFGPGLTIEAALLD